MHVALIFIPISTLLFIIGCFLVPKEYLDIIALQLRIIKMSQAFTDALAAVEAAAETKALAAVEAYKAANPPVDPQPMIDAAVAAKDAENTASVNALATKIAG